MAQVTFGEALRLALFNAGRSQTWLANQLGTGPSQVNRWIKSRQLPHIDTVRKIDELLNVDLSEAYRQSFSPDDELSKPPFELFVSAPITGLKHEDVQAHQRQAAKVVGAAERVVGHGKVFWPSWEVAHLYDLGVADIATEHSLKVLASCRAYLYLQLTEMINPSGGLVELGIALGRKIKTTMIIQKDVRTPVMFDAFQAVAARLDFLPEVHIYVVTNVDEAVRLIEQAGIHLLLSG
jgi:transcriptional regulator with XRE-family HTH domain